MTEDKERKEGVADIYKTLIDAIGFDNTKRVYDIFRGQQVSFPKNFYRAEYITKQVVDRFDGTNLRELAREYNYTERYLRNLIAKSKKELGNNH